MQIGNPPLLAAINVQPAPRTEPPHPGAPNAQSTTTAPAAQSRSPAARPQPGSAPSPSHDPTTEPGRAILRQRGIASTSARELSAEQQQELRRLQTRDRQVRAHEAAHHAAAGAYARSGPQYELTRGPDGRQYATGGEVKIDTRPVPGDPEATLRKAQQIRRAALAPQEPSSQDRQVAAAAAAMAQQARLALQQQSTEPARRDAAPAAQDTPPSDTDSAPASRASCPECGGDHGREAHRAANAQRLQNLVAMITDSTSQSLSKPPPPSFHLTA